MRGQRWLFIGGLFSYSPFSNAFSASAAKTFSASLWFFDQCQSAFSGYFAFCIVLGLITFYILHKSKECNHICLPLTHTHYSHPVGPGPLADDPFAKTKMWKQRIGWLRFVVLFRIEKVTRQSVKFSNNVGLTKPLLSFAMFQSQIIIFRARLTLAIGFATSHSC